MVAVTNEMWYINAFSVHPQLGFSMLDDGVECDGTIDQKRRDARHPPFFSAINNFKSEQMALIVLEASDDYKFVETGADGEVEHFRPSLVGGERHHMINVIYLFTTN